MLVCVVVAELIEAGLDFARHRAVAFSIAMSFLARRSDFDWQALRA